MRRITIFLILLLAAGCNGTPPERVSREDSLHNVRRLLQLDWNGAIESGDEERMAETEAAYDDFMERHEEDFLDVILTIFTDEQRYGEYKEYYATGEVKVVTPRVDGETHGTLRVFYKNGALARSVEYKHNLEDGFVRCYYRNGEPEAEGRMSRGERVGTWRFFHPDGTLRTSETYNKKPI